MSLRYCTAALVLLLIALPAPQPAGAQVTGINYTVSPIGGRVYWDDQAALSDGWLYGGELGLGFGEFFELGGIYLFGNGFETDFSELSGDDPAVLAALAALDPRDVNLRRYGGKLRVNLGRGNLVPFVTLGTGVLRFDPDDLSASENIYANGGAGLTFSLADRYTLSVAAENLVYRYNAGRTFFSADELAGIGLTPDNFNQQTVYNPALSASAKFYLGGRGEGELTEVDRALLRQLRGGGFRLAVEPFYGQINFNDDLDFPETQAVAGVNAGVDLGPYVGVRGFYWRALEQEAAFDDGIQTDFTELEFYGGELDLRFQGDLVRGLTPYVIVGGGYADVGDGYRDFSGVRPESRYFAIGGGGVELPITRSVKLQAGLRGLFMSNQDIEDVAEPSNVFSSLMYTGGINFNIGSGGGSLGGAVAEEAERGRSAERARAEAMAAELAMLRARIDSLETARRFDPPRYRPPNEAAVGPAWREVVVADGDTVLVESERAFAGRTLTIPVPEEGAIYIRFGNAQGPEPVFGQPMMMPGMQTPVYLRAPADSALADSLGAVLTAEQIRQMVAEAVAEQQPDPGLTAEEFERSLRRMEQRLEQRIAETQRPRREAGPTDVTVVQEGDRIVDEEADREPSTLVETFNQRELVAVQPLIGLRLGEGPEQFLIGARADYRFPGRQSRLAPELALAFGDKVALSALANVLYPFGGGYLDTVQPYAGAGVGFVSDSGLSGLDLTLNLLVGAEYTFSNGLTFFGEYSTLDFFDFNRILVGYRWNF
ncbi:MAG: hypothetical protein R3247_09670 [Rhodothermales bacterium]|nr:hypothetical protein [Rhodothermales bacterium]